MHNITIKIKIIKASRAPTTKLQNPKRSDISFVANVKYTNTDNIIIAVINETIGTYLGKQCVNAILNNPHPTVKINT
jgi:hypothetical protein